jgi:hypothetical protein
MGKIMVSAIGSTRCKERLGFGAGIAARKHCACISLPWVWAFLSSRMSQWAVECSLTELVMILIVSVASSQSRETCEFAGMRAKKIVLVHANAGFLLCIWVYTNSLQNDIRRMPKQRNSAKPENVHSSSPQTKIRNMSIPGSRITLS